MRNKRREDYEIKNQSEEKWRIIAVYSKTNLKKKQIRGKHRNNSRGKINCRSDSHGSKRNSKDKRSKNIRRRKRKQKSYTQNRI